MKKIYLLVLFVVSAMTVRAQVTFSPPSPQYGCPNTTHNVTVGVQNTSGIGIPGGFPYTITVTIFDNTPTQIYTSSQNFSDAIANNAVKSVTLTNVPFVGAMICNVAVDLAYDFPGYSGTYSTNGAYEVKLPPNLTITENPTGTIEVQTALDGYSVRYYLDANYASHTAESAATTYTPSSSGSYTAKAYDPLSTCISATPSNALSFTISSTTAAAQKFNFSVYPNPMTSSLTISTTLSSPLEYVLTDVNGVVQETASFSSTAQVDVSGATTGTYLLSIKENGTLLTTYKLVK